jgi:hypothetical protein
VLSAIGVVSGDNGSFRPTDGLTRGAAAKIICNMILGPTTASALSADAAPFKDVPTNNVFAGYIAYCAKQGIISGYADGTFRPADPLSGYAFMKMLLGALGYDSSVEGYTGANWSINVAKRALNLGLDSNLTGDFVGTKAVNREEACLYAFNTLLSTMVTYDNSIIVNNGTIGTTSRVTEVYSGISSNQNIKSGTPVNGQYTVEFAEQYFPKMSLGTTFAEGARYRTVIYNGKTIADTTLSGTILATSTKGTAYEKLVNEANSNYIGYKADDTVTFYYNDGAVTDAYNDDGSNRVEDRGSSGSNSGLWYEGGTDVELAGVKGVIVNFIDTNSNGKYDIVSYVQKSVVKLAATPSTKVSGSVTYVNMPGVNSNILSTAIKYPDGLEKGDVVLYYTNADSSKTYVYKTESVSGTISAYSDGSSKVTIDGTSYAISGLSGAPASYDTYGEIKALIGETGYTFYLDDGNNIVYTVAPSAAATLNNSFFVTAADVTSSFGSYTYQAKVITKDGGSPEIITVKKTAADSGTMTELSGDYATAVVAAGSMADGALALNTFYVYEKNSDGSYNLTEAANQDQYLTTVDDNDGKLADDDYSYSIKGNAANFLIKNTIASYTNGGSNTSWTADGVPGKLTTTTETVVGTANSVFAYYNSTSKTYDVTVGIANASSYNVGGDIYVLTDANGYALMTVAKGATTSAATSSYDKVFLTGGATVTKDDDNVSIYSFPAIINGEVGQTYKTYSSSLSAGDLVFVKEYKGDVAVSGSELTSLSGVTKYTSLKATADDNSNGYYFDKGESALYVDGLTATITVSGPTNYDHILSADCAVYLYDKNDTSAPVVTQISIEQAALLEFDATNDTIWVVETSSSNATIASMYIFID